MTEDINYSNAKRENVLGLLVDTNYPCSCMLKWAHVVFFTDFSEMGKGNEGERSEREKWQTSIDKCQKNIGRIACCEGTKKLLYGGLFEFMPFLPKY